MMALGFAPKDYWALLNCHRVYLKHGLVAIGPSLTDADSFYFDQMRENWEGDPAEDCGPNADFRGTRDAVAVEIARQWAAILDTPNGMSPKKGAIARPGEGSFQALSYN